MDLKQIGSESLNWIKLAQDISCGKFVWALLLYVN
jgi:hypothetical protein